MSCCSVNKLLMIIRIIIIDTYKDIIIDNFYLLSFINMLMIYMYIYQIFCKFIPSMVCWFHKRDF